MTSLEVKIHDLIRKTFGGGLLPLHTPDFSDEESRAVAGLVDTTFVSYISEAVTFFERDLTELTGVKSAVAVSSGTAALHLLLREIGVQSGDEVILPAISFVATANAVAYQNAIPHFVDIDPVTLGLNADALNQRLRSISLRRDGVTINKVTGRRIAGIVVVHALGHLANMPAIADIANEYSLPVIEDAAGALGSKSEFGSPGKNSIGAAISFNGNKIVTTGGGGAVLTESQDLAERISYVSSTAKKPHPWEFEHTEIGFNYRMPGLNAALGRAQLKRFESILSRKRNIAVAYRQLFQGLSEVDVLLEPHRTKSNFWLNAFSLSRPSLATRDSILTYLTSNGIGARPLWKPLHELRPFKNSPHGDISAASEAYRSIVCLPSSSHLLTNSH